MKYKIAILGLGMGSAWAKAAVELPNAELLTVYDPWFTENSRIDYALFEKEHTPVASSEEEVYASEADVIIIASPDHLHKGQCIRALQAGKHVICEKPLAPTVAECREIVKAAAQSGRQFMTGQVCRYAPGFVTAKALLDAGRIGELVYVESEYAHDYSHAALGFREWRKDPVIRRQGFLGGGCHALDLTRWIAGEPEEVTCYCNHKILTDWPTPDTGVAIAKFPGDVIGRIFVSTGAKRPYTMRTCLYGTHGTIICDNTSADILLCEDFLEKPSGCQKFARIPVEIANHNVTSELSEFLGCLESGAPCPTDALQGLRTVAFAEAAIRSSQTGLPVKPERE